MADLDSIFGFLGEDSEEGLPEGGQFTNTGFIGLVTAKKLWQLWCAEDIAHYELPYKEGVDFYKRGQEGSWWYYFVHSDAAKKAADAMQRFNPTHVWRFEMPTDTVLNFRSADAADKWGQSISSDARIVGLGSKYRHEMQFLSLPAIVDAFARTAGKIKERVFHIDELLNAQSEDLTDDFEWRLIGHPDANKTDIENFEKILEAVNGNLEVAQDIALGKAETVPESVQELSGYVKIHWRHGLLFQRRKALWAALGEDNAEVYLPKGVSTTASGKKLETTSDDLSLCLAVATKEWQAPVWMRLFQVPDPRVGSAYKSNSGDGMRRPLLPVVGEIFLDEDTAKAAVEADGGEVVTATAKVSNEDMPPMPENWGTEEAVVKDWMDLLGQKKKDLGGVLPTAIPALVKLAQEYSCAIDDLKNWWPLV